jgi:septum site-determining protein MinD
MTNEELPGDKNMAARILTITSGKGGVGKTTATANLGVALALNGQRVVTIDADIGLRNLDVMMGLENRIVYDLVDVVEGRCRLRQAMIRDKRLSELYLLPAAQTRDKTAVSPEDMVRITDQLRPEFDFIIIDSPAGIEQGFRNAIAPADEVLIITTPEISAVRDADRIIGLVEAEEKESTYLIINRLRPDMVRLIGIVPEDENIIVSTNRGRPATLDDNSSAGKAFRNIARRVMGEDVPFMVIRENPSLLDRLARLMRGRERPGR